MKKYQTDKYNIYRQYLIMFFWCFNIIIMGKIIKLEECQLHSRHNKISIKLYLYENFYTIHL